jgi:hypothetical protein
VGDRLDPECIREIESVEEIKIMAKFLILPVSILKWEEEEIIKIKDEPVYLKKDIVELHT